MKKIVYFAAASLMMFCSFLATSCDSNDDNYDETPENNFIKTPDNYYVGDCSLSAMGMTVDYKNGLHLSNHGTTVSIDSISFKSMYNIKNFEIKDLKFNSTDNVHGTITLDSSKKYIVEKDSIQFEILDANCTVGDSISEFIFQIHPKGMPGDGFKFTLKGEKTLDD